MRQNHRRIKRDRLQTIYVRKRTVRKDSEGVPEESFSAAYGMQAEVWAASERRQIEAYGDRIADIANVRIQAMNRILMRIMTNRILMSASSKPLPLVTVSVSMLHRQPTLITACSRSHFQGRCCLRLSGGRSWTDLRPLIIP